VEAEGFALDLLLMGLFLLLALAFIVLFPLVGDFFFKVSEPFALLLLLVLVEGTGSRFKLSLRSVATRITLAMPDDIDHDF